MGSIPIGSAIVRDIMPAQHNTIAARFRELLLRLAASAYDVLVLAGVLALGSLVIIIARGGAAIPAGNPAYRLFLLALTAAYFIGFWSRGGQTPGMRTWNLRVETAAGTPLPIALATGRFAAALLSAACLGIGLAWLLVDRDQLAWHDRLSGTRVVRLAPRRVPLSGPARP